MFIFYVVPTEPQEGWITFFYKHCVPTGLKTHKINAIAKNHQKYLKLNNPGFNLTSVEFLCYCIKRWIVPPTIIT